MSSPPRPSASSSSAFPLCSEAREMIEVALEARRRELEELLSRCESPLEQMLLVALWERWGCRVTENRLAMHALLGDGPGDSEGFLRVVVEPQKPIHVGPTRYRADLFCYVLKPGDARRILHSPLVIEVDGHEFHERSKLQAARDRQRDRGMLLEGFRVIRFSGSEVYNQPEECAREIEQLMRREMRARSAP